MHDFYRVTDAGSRPRVLALVTPTADRRFHFDSKTLKLEQTLDAKVLGVNDDKRAQILALPDRPNEVVIVYDYSQRNPETRLLKALHVLDPTESVFRRYYHSSRGANREIGPCASDLVWRRNLKAIESELTADYDDVDEDDTDVPPVELMKIQMFNVIRNWAYAMPNLDPSSRGFNVSHKFVRLVQALNTFKAYGEAFRGIIFGKEFFDFGQFIGTEYLTVRKHITASVLADLLRTLDDRLSFLRPQAVIGHGHYNDHSHYVCSQLIFVIIIANRV
jgi:endoribonuclease Dicer